MAAEAAEKTDEARPKVWKGFYSAVYYVTNFLRFNPVIQLYLAEKIKFEPCVVEAEIRKKVV